MMTNDPVTHPDARRRFRTIGCRKGGSSARANRVSRVTDRAFSVRTTDDRVVEVLTAGPTDGTPLIFNTGSPGGAALFPLLTEAAAEHHLRVVHYSRPGFGRSTAQPGRSVADAAGDVAAILDSLWADRFVTMGWSGGGPHALASAALLSDRCAAAASVSGSGPYGAAGLDWFAGMDDCNREAYSLAAAGDIAGLTALNEAEAPRYPTMRAQPLDHTWAGHPARADVAAFREFAAATCRNALVEGIAGWRDDELALTRPWGFEVEQIRCPVTIWHGEADQMVPVGHGRWLTNHISGARAHFEPGLNHGALMRTHFRGIVAELATLAARSTC